MTVNTRYFIDKMHWVRVATVIILCLTLVAQARGIPVKNILQRELISADRYVKNIDQTISELASALAKRNVKKLQQKKYDASQEDHFSRQIEKKNRVNKVDEDSRTVPQTRQSMPVRENSWRRSGAKEKVYQKRLNDVLDLMLSTLAGETAKTNTRLIDEPKVNYSTDDVNKIPNSNKKEEGTFYERIETVGNNDIEKETLHILQELIALTKLSHQRDKERQMTDTFEEKNKNYSSRRRTLNEILQLAARQHTASRNSRQNYNNIGMSPYQIVNDKLTKTLNKKRNNDESKDDRTFNRLFLKPVETKLGVRESWKTIGGEPKKEARVETENNRIVKRISHCTLRPKQECSKVCYLDKCHDYCYEIQEKTCTNL